MSKARDSVEFLNSPDDREVWRSSRAIIGYDDDSDITNNTSALTNNQLLLRYSTAYANAETKNAVQAQRYIKADTGGVGGSFKAYTILGAENGTDTPEIGDYQPEWCVNVELDNYSDKTDADPVVSCGFSSTVRRYGAQGLMAIHCNAMDMRCPDTATDSDMGGITGMEAHSDGVGPDHRTSGGTGYGYRQTIRCTARTKSTTPTWTKRGTAPMNNGAAVLRDDICFPKDAVVAENYVGTYFVCTTAGTLGGTDTVLDAATVPGTEVTDGTAIWECRIGAEIGVALKILNGDFVDDGGGPGGYYRYGIIISNNDERSNPNQIAHAIYVKNSGDVNFESYGDPDWHALMSGIAATGNLGLGSELTTGTTAKISLFGDNASGARTVYSAITATILDDTAGAEDGRLVLSATTAGVGETHVYLEGMNTIIGEKSVLATNATAGFLHIGRCAGAPSGVPDLYTGKCPMVVDSTNGRLYVYHSGGWHYAALT
jgi:hypothetical protein